MWSFGRKLMATGICTLISSTPTSLQPEPAVMWTYTKERLPAHLSRLLVFLCDWWRGKGGEIFPRSSLLRKLNHSSSALSFPILYAFFCTSRHFPFLALPSEVNTGKCSLLSPEWRRDFLVLCLSIKVVHTARSEMPSFVKMSWFSSFKILSDLKQAVHNHLADKSQTC